MTLEELVHDFGPPLAIGGLIMSVGYFLDGHVHESYKRYVAARIRGARDLPLVRSAVDVCILVYERIFSTTARSWRFYWRSQLAYCAIMTLLVLFYALFYPATFFNVISGLFFGDSFSAISTWGLLAVGGVLFWAANAQTLYFLRLAQTDQRLIHIGLVLYADVLLTASICVLGIAGILTAHTAAAVLYPPENIELLAQVKMADAVYAEEIAAAEQESSEVLAHTLDKLTDGRSTLSDLPAIEFTNRPSSTRTQNFARDLDLAERYLERSNGPAVIRLPGVGIQILDRRGKIASFATEDSQLHTQPATWFAETLTLQQVCHQLMHPNLSNTDRYIDLLEYNYSKDLSVQSCVRGEPFPIRARGELNTKNIDFSSVFSQNVVRLLASLAQWAYSGVLAAGNNHPLRGFGLEEESEFWIHNHVIQERAQGGMNALDAALLDAILIEKGKGNIINTNGYPAPLVISAIMATSAFTFLLLMGAVLASVASMGLGFIGKAETWLKFDDKPFATLGAFTSIVVIAVAFIM